MPERLTIETDREDDGQGERAAGVRGTERDRRGNRRTRCHVGDALEQDLAQPDGVLAQLRCGNGRHGDLTHLIRSADRTSPDVD